MIQLLKGPRQERRKLINIFKGKKTKSSQESDLIKRTDERRRILLDGSIKHLIRRIVFFIGAVVLTYFLLYIAFSPLRSPLSIVLALVITIAVVFFTPLLARYWYKLENRHPVVHLVNLEYKEAGQYVYIRMFSVGLDYWNGMRPKLAPVKTPFGDYYVVRQLVLNRYGEAIEAL